MLVVNDTKVIQARLFGEYKGRRFEILLLAPTAGGQPTWKCLVRPGRYIDDKGSELTFPEGVTASVIRREGREFEVCFHCPADSFQAWLARAGHVPLPPYIQRPDNAADRVSYQTIYAKDPTSVAAPTAGLHFTPELIANLKTKGIEFQSLTLDIGYGTFAPLEPGATELHAEKYRIPAETVESLARARKEGRRIIAVGTTALRAMEASTAEGPDATTRLFIQPGYRFTQVDGLITNFHLPQSSLFILVCAFLGKEAAQDAYAHALGQGYRFYSYGDAMVIL